MERSLPLKTDLVRFSPDILRPVLSPFHGERPIDWTAEFPFAKRLEVEIGFGLGEVLIRNAMADRATAFVGLEQHWERIFRALKSIHRLRGVDPKLFENVRLLDVDAREAFFRLFSARTIDRIYCLFPCPWPKKKHVKHRLFSKAFFRLLNNRLKSRGVLEIVTDDALYFEWVKEQSRGNGFSIQTGEIAPRFGTKFEKKWKEEGQERFYQLQCRKVKHLSMAVGKDVAVKSFSVKAFDPDHFQFEDLRGDPSVIFKDFLFDPKRQKAVVRLIVQEGSLVQHLRVAVSRRAKDWNVHKADGQNLLPTPAINVAIERVYDAARRGSQVSS